MKINFGFKPMEERKIRNKRLKPGNKLEIVNLGTRTDKREFNLLNIKIGDIVTFKSYHLGYVNINEDPQYINFERTCFKLIE